MAGLGAALVLNLTACGGGDSVQLIERSAAERIVIAGSGAPADAAGQDGDFYLDAPAGLLYGPRTGGHWPTPPTPITGPAGPAGAAGQDGSRIYSDNGPPDPALGADGDYYLDQATATLFGPRAGGAWPATGLVLSSPVLPGATAGVSLRWTIPDNTGNGNGTYYLNPQGITTSLRYPVLLPQGCAQARLQVSTFGTPLAGNSFVFQVLRTPGPDLSTINTAAVAGLACTLTDAVRSCDVASAVGLQDGDAIEVQMTGTQAINATGGSWAVGFSCQ